MPSSKKDDAVKVALRVRPLIDIEQVQRCRAVIKYPHPNQLVIGDQRAFTYDFVYKEEETQAQIYQTTVQPIVKQFLKGYNTTIFAYGQTGSGKTFTMGTGSSKHISEKNLGIVPRVCREIFETVQNAPENTEYRVRVAFMEIHNEEIVDLLDNAQDVSKRPQIREMPNGEIVVQPMVEQEVKSASEMLGCLERGSLHRATGSTLMNAQSSRSHAIFTVFLDLTVYETDVGAAETSPADQLSSKFHFVDLAGSERLKRTGAVGQRMKEGISINSGLLALGNVISALGDEKRKAAHVPFRDSKITRLLQDSLGGNSKTLMFACVSPADVNYEETLNTLKYANRAKNIQNKAIINRDPNAAKIQALNKRIQELEAALAGGGISSSSGINAQFSSAFEQNEEELHFLREQGSAYEMEIHRLTTSLKEARQQLGVISDKLITAETERDTFKLRIKTAMDKLAAIPNAPDIGLGTEVDQKELDVLKNNLGEIQTLKERVQRQASELKQAALENNRLRQMVADSRPDLFSSEPVLMSPRKQPSLAHRGRTFSKDDAAFEVLEARKRLSGGPKQFNNGLNLFGVGDVVVPRSVQESLDDEDLEDEEEEEEQSFADSQNDEVQGLQTLTDMKEREHNFEMNRLQEQHTRMANDIVQKENLMKQLLKTRETANAMRRHYEQKIAEMEADIASITVERTRVLSSPVKRSAAEELEQKQLIVKYEKRMEMLRVELQKMRDKLNENKRLQAAKKNDEHRINSLKSEIDATRKEKVRLARKMKEENDKHRVWVTKTSHKMRQMEREARKHKLKLQATQDKMSKQTAVLKRRVAERNKIQKDLEKAREEIQTSRRRLRNQEQELRNKARRGPVYRPGRVAAQTRAGKQDVASDIGDLKNGFKQEIEKAVRKLEIVSEHAKLQERRDQALAKLRKAERTLADTHGLPDEEREAWKEQKENLQSQIKYLNSQIVQRKVDITRRGRSNNQTQRSVFTRHPIARLDQGRSVILYLMDEIVQMKRDQNKVKDEMEDLRIRRDYFKSELDEVTRKYLSLQNTPAAQEMLEEMDEEQSEQAHSNANANPVEHFFRALNVQPGPMENNWVDGEEVSQLSGDDEPPERTQSLRRHRSRSQLPPRATARDSSLSRKARSKEKPSKGRAHEARSLPDSPRGGRKNQSVFSRLTNSQNFTGIHKQKLEEQKLREQQDRERRTKEVKERKEKSGKRSKGAVFDRLTDTKSYTGTHRVVHKEISAAKDGGKARSLSQMENDLASLNLSWQLSLNSSKPKDSKKKDRRGRRKKKSSSSTPSLDGTGEMNTYTPPPAAHNPLNPPSSMPMLSPNQMSGVASPVDKQTALSAVKKLDSLFDRIKKKKSEDNPAASPLDKDKLRAQMDARLQGNDDSEDSDDSAPNADDVLNALALNLDG